MGVPYDDDIADCIRQALAGRNAVETKMMGGLCFMVDGHMACGVTGAALMVRVGPDAYQHTLTQPHVRPMDIGGSRPRGFVLIDPDGFRTEARLLAWVQKGLDTAGALPAKAAAEWRGRVRPAKRSEQ